MRPIFAALAAATAFICPSTDAIAQRAEPTDEIVVVGERAGPRFWRVKDEDSEVFVLVSVDYVPEDFDWSERQTAFVLEEADLLIAPPRTKAGAGDRARFLLTAVNTLIFNRGRIVMPKGTTLGDKIGEGLAAQYDAAYATAKARGAARKDRRKAARKLDEPPALEEFEDPNEKAIAEQLAKIDDSRLHPVFQGGRLIEAAIDGAGLAYFSDEVSDRIEKLARKADVEIQPIAAFDIQFSDVTNFLKSVRNFSEETNVACVAAAIDFAENDLERAHNLARAWARGDAAYLRRVARPPEIDPCGLALSREIGGLATFGGATVESVDPVGAWLVAIEDALETPGVRLAVVPLDTWLGPDVGVKDRLATRGATVIEP
ncbi:MAG: TraB/GumN family protein [Parvularculaceae bacterium]